MSLEIIEYTYNDANSISEIIATIKQRTGLELEALDSGSAGIQKFSMRFPDMETAQSIGLEYLNDSGIFFIDANNHFLCYSIASGLDSYSYVNDLYKALVFDSNGKLANVCYTTRREFYYTMTAYGGYAEDNNSKSNITLCPLRVYANNNLNGANNVYAFVKNCYVNYERKFQRNLKFIDQNGNEFITLGGYLLYYNGKHK